MRASLTIQTPLHRPRLRRARDRYIEEYPVARFHRDAKILTIGEGTDEVQQLAIARQLGAQSAAAAWSPRQLGAQSAAAAWSARQLRDVFVAV